MRLGYLSAIRAGPAARRRHSERMGSDDDAEEFLAPIGWAKPIGEPLPDAEMRRVLVAMCERGGQHQPPTDLCEEARSRLDDGDPPPSVARWLGTALGARGLDTWWVRALLNDSA